MTSKLCDLKSQRYCIFSLIILSANRQRSTSKSKSQRCLCTHIRTNWIRIRTYQVTAYWLPCVRWAASGVDVAGTAPPLAMLSFRTTTSPCRTPSKPRRAPILPYLAPALRRFQPTSADSGPPYCADGPPPHVDSPMHLSGSRRPAHEIRDTA